MVQMLSKLFVLRETRFLFIPVRNLGGLTPLEKFERLRQLCCTSDMERKKIDVYHQFRPRTQEVDDKHCEKSCSECCGRRPQELLDIRCKTALVLGGGSSVGFETADHLLKSGVLKVIIGDESQAVGMSSVKKLQSAYGNSKACFVMADVGDPVSLEKIFKSIYERFCQVDICINCVGIYNETPQCWDKMVKKNLIGCACSTILAYKYMGGNTQDETCQGSVIVNVSSYGAIANVPSMPLFSAASNGINGLTSSFGQNFHFSKTGVRCVAVCPSCTDSELLKNMSRLHYDRSWAAHSANAIRCCTRQSPKVVGKAITNAARFGINGSVYVVKDGSYYRYAMPDYMKIMRQEAILF